MTTNDVAERIFNFSAGPAVMPVPVLRQVQRELLALPGCGASIMEISHRSKQFEALHHDAQQRLRSLLSIPDRYKILFLQGGSRLQFSMLPMNLLRGTGLTADYILTGSWGKNAKKEADKEGQTRALWDGKATNYDRLPTADELRVNPGAAYVHITSNETIEGVQFLEEPRTGDVPLVCDASSDFLCRPLNIERYGVLYACAQKNAGPAGLTIVIIREDLLARSREELPGYLNYSVHAEHDSLWNTPCTLGIYVFGLIARWLQEEIGGLAEMRRRNAEKAQLLYQTLDASAGFYRGHAQPDCRSIMNVTFRLPSAELEKEFVSEAAKRRLDGLKGHRSVGGIRASIYNAMPLEGVTCLRDFMVEFRDRHAG